MAKPKPVFRLYLFNRIRYQISISFYFKILFRNSPTITKSSSIPQDISIPQTDN